MVTEAGILKFNPAGPIITRPAEPYLASIRVNDVPISGNETPRFLNTLVRAYTKNNFDFKLSTIADGNSPASAVEYQLANYDSKAVRVPPGTTVRYPNLPPGTYTLQLTAINQNGLPSGKKSLQIIINPPYWQTWWFRVAALFALALIAAGIYIAGLRRERLKQQRLSDQQARLAAERDRIAGEVHDDLGGQISSILYLSEEMLLTGTAPANERELNRIHELSRTSLQNVRDIIFALDNRRATLAALGDQLRGAGTDFFTDRKIAFTCADTFARPDFSLTSRQKRNLTLILKEAWHNTAKHAAATAVQLDITQANGTLHLTCADNGKGFTSTTSKKATGGYGLENMTEKAAAIGATVSLESVPGKGTTLHIDWPLPEQDP
jgi:signal transduction histidine kinase